MAKRLSHIAHTDRSESFAGQRIGQIVRITEDGVPWVDFRGNPVPAAVEARSILDAPAAPTATLDALVGQSVLLVFEDSDPQKPIICGVIRTRLQPKPVVPAVTLDESGTRDVLVDGRQLVLSGQQQILLRCGKSSILLRRDGKIVIRGTHLLSRSSGPNKIKGGSIDLN